MFLCVLQVGCPKGSVRSLAMNSGESMSTFRYAALRSLVQALNDMQVNVELAAGFWLMVAYSLIGYTISFVMSRYKMSDTKVLDESTDQNDEKVNLIM